MISHFEDGASRSICSLFRLSLLFPAIVSEYETARFPCNGRACGFGGSNRSHFARFALQTRALVLCSCKNHEGSGAGSELKSYMNVKHFASLDTTQCELYSRMFTLY